MTERQFRYFITALLVLPLIFFVDALAHPISLNSGDLREIFYPLFSITIIFLAYCAWFHPQVIQEMFGPLRPDNPPKVTETPSTAPSQTKRIISILVAIIFGILIFCGLGNIAIISLRSIGATMGFLPTPQPSHAPFVEINAIQTATVQPALTGVAPTQSTDLPVATLEPQSTDLSIATSAPQSTDLPALTATARPSETNSEQQPIQPGTYLVQTDIQPGIYKGLAGTTQQESCYWARLKDLTGNSDGLLANENEIGQFYLEVKTSDYALQTDCPIQLVSPLPEYTGEYPQSIQAGTYLVGIDIQPGKYKGQAGNDFTTSCYWARLSNVSGDFDALLADENATGAFQVTILKSDFAFVTKCNLDRVGD